MEQIIDEAQRRPARTFDALFAPPLKAGPLSDFAPEDSMDAITLLKDDHKLIRRLLGELESTTTRAAKKRKELLVKVAANLKAHTTIEEEIFYPAFKEAGKKSDDDKMYFEALEEHRAAGDLVLPDLLRTDPSSEKFSGRAKVLKE